jgi:hypothetical protein
MMIIRKLVRIHDQDDDFGEEADENGNISHALLLSMMAVTMGLLMGLRDCTNTYLHSPRT